MKADKIISFAIPAHMIHRLGTITPDNTIKVQNRWEDGWRARYCYSGSIIQLLCNQAAAASRPRWRNVVKQGERKRLGGTTAFRRCGVPVETMQYNRAIRDHSERGKKEHTPKEVESCGMCVICKSFYFSSSGKKQQSDENKNTSSCGQLGKLFFPAGFWQILWKISANSGEKNDLDS